MAERTIGSGQVMIWSSTLDNYWNDLALKPVYLPFVHELIRMGDVRGAGQLVHHRRGHRPLGHLLARRRASACRVAQARWC